MHPRLTAAALGLAALALAGCANVYTRHMSETYKDNKLDGKTFAVLPIVDIEYNPPGSCMGPGKDEGPKYEKPWLDGVAKDLQSTFKKQTFRTYTAEELKELNIDAALLFSKATDEVTAMGVKQYEAAGGEVPKVVYEAARPSGKVAEYVRRLRERDSIDYVIMLVQPKMTGKTQTHYHAGAGGAPGGVSSSTTYTSDVQFGVWSAETGELAYASGSISASSGFCFFVSPQQASINGTTRNLAEQLKALIAALLRERGPGPVELGMGSQPSR